MHTLKLTKFITCSSVLSIFLTISLCQGMDENTYHGQMLLLVPRNDVQQKYEDLFLDDWQKLVLKGENQEATQLAKKQEQVFIEIERGNRYDKNEPSSYADYRESQKRQGLSLTEKYNHAHFRIYEVDPQKIIKNHENRIQALKMEIEKRNQKINELEELGKTGPLQKEIVRAKIDTDYASVINKLNQDIPHKESYPTEKIDVVKNIINTIYYDIKEQKPKLTSEYIESQKKELNGLTASIISALEELSDKNNTDSKLINMKISLFKLSVPWFMETIEEWFNMDENLRLNKWEVVSLKKMKEAHEAFIEDTNEKITKEEERINFIKTNPTFFKIKARSRADILGIEDPSQWSSEKSTLKLGKGVVVGIIDSFDTCKQTSRILTKSINPDFEGKGCTQQIGQEADDGKHGIHVAGIIVSDLIDKNDNGMTLGVAPEAEFEMLSYQSLSTTLPSIAHDYTEKHITVEDMANTINELAHTGKVPSLGISFDEIQDNPIVKSPAKILNWSMGSSSLERFGRAFLNVFEGLDTVPVLVKCLQSKLLVRSAGNDGVDLSSTRQHRLSKALAYSLSTSPHLILVTNVMQDGISLNPSTNIPGDEPYLQARTLSAPGTDISSTVLMRSEEETAAYEEMTGTSMSAPHVSGIAAVVLSNHENLTPKELAQCLLEGATPLLINEDGVTSELPDILAGELNHKFDNSSPRDTAVEIRGIQIKRADWERGKESYGQGRVSLKGALQVAKEIDLS